MNAFDTVKLCVIMADFKKHLQSFGGMCMDMTSKADTYDEKSMSNDLYGLMDVIKQVDDNLQENLDWKEKILKEFDISDKDIDDLAKKQDPEQLSPGAS